MLAFLVPSLPKLITIHITIRGFLDLLHSGLSHLGVLGIHIGIF